MGLSRQDSLGGESGESEEMAMSRQEQANRYLNQMRSRPKREYGFAYLAWLKNGCVGREPRHPGVPHIVAKAVRMELDEILVDPLDLGLNGRR